jgi:uncharacterized protein YjbI with pentapeptide repeats
MKDAYIESKDFKGTDFSKEELVRGEYENCTFSNCNFLKADLTGMIFLECTFSNCDLSLMKLATTAMREVKFRSCKMLGLHFEDCNSFLFAVSFEGCVLNLSSFYKLSIKKTKFINCSLHEVDFTEADLSLSIMENCDLNGAIFQQAIAEKADFRTAYNFLIDPEVNRLKKAKFSSAGLAGLLYKYDIDIT